MKMFNLVILICITLDIFNNIAGMFVVEADKIVIMFSPCLMTLITVRSCIIEYASEKMKLQTQEHNERILVENNDYNNFILLKEL